MATAPGQRRGSRSCRRGRAPRPVDRQDVDGTLFSATTKDSAAAGTITRLRDEGDTVTRGRR
jgi:hypothetical protein